MGEPWGVDLAANSFLSLLLLLTQLGNASFSSLPRVMLALPDLVFPVVTARCHTVFPLRCSLGGGSSL